KLERCDLMPSDVTAVIDDDVYAAVEKRQRRAEHRGVGLVARHHRRIGVDTSGAGRIDVDPDDLCVRTKIFPPNLRRAAAAHAELKDPERPGALRAETLEMAVIDLQIVMPFVRDLVVVRVEQPLQIVRWRSRAARSPGREPERIGRYRARLS